MYKCDKCEEYAYAVIVNPDGTRECFDCLCEPDESVKSVKNIEPPLGWMGTFHKEDVMLSYGTIGTKLFKGTEH